MNDDIINDLKQFISATVSQQTTSLRDDIKEDMQGILKEVSKLEAKMDEGFAGVGDAIDALTQSIEPKIDDHEVRISKLESQPAQ